MTRVLVCLVFVAGGCADAATEAAVPACPARCDDGDPCTEGRCDPAIGRCEHVPREVVDACRIDAHCEDGNRCTSDVCLPDPECPVLFRCATTNLPGCRACDGRFEGECDDFDPCTTDRCGSEGFCVYEQGPAWCDPGCDAEHVARGFIEVGPSALIIASPGVFDPPPCNVCPCPEELWLADELAGLAYRVALDEARCDLGCGLNPICTPFVFARNYVVYGTVTRPFDQAIMAPEGWCLMLDAGGLAGPYDGTLALDAEPEPYTFTGSIDHNLLLALDGHLPRLTPAAGSRVAENFGNITLQLGLDGKPISATLYPGRDRLHGVVATVIGQRIGTLTLVVRTAPLE